MSDTNKIAEAYLRELLAGNGTTAMEVEHVAPQQRRESVYDSGTANEFLERMRKSFDAIPAPQSLNERVEIEEPTVILQSGKRYFQGFLKSNGNPRPVFSFCANLAQEFTSMEAARLQRLLDLLGHKSEQRPSLAQKASSL